MPFAAASESKGKKKGKRGNAEKGYGTYLHKVMKTVHTDPNNKITISSKAMEVLNGIIEDLEARLTTQAFKLTKLQKKSTLAANHVMTATHLVFPMDMGGMAVGEGSKALTKYTS